SSRTSDVTRGRARGTSRRRKRRSPCRCGARGGRSGAFASAWSGGAVSPNRISGLRKPSPTKPPSQCKRPASWSVSARRRERRGPARLPSELCRRSESRSTPCSPARTTSTAYPRTSCARLCARLELPPTRPSRSRGGSRRMGRRRTWRRPSLDRVQPRPDPDRPMLVVDTAELVADVLVIGAGVAALRAAIAAREAGADVLLCCKGIAGRSGNTIVSTADISAYVPELGVDDSEDTFAADTLQTGGTIADERLVRLLVERSGPALLDLERLGIRLLRADGQIDRTRAAG